VNTSTSHNRDQETTEKAERSLLGIALSDPDKTDEIVEVIPSSVVFASKQHRKIWDEITRQYSNGENIDAITIADAVGANVADLLEMQTSDAYYMSLASSAKLIIAKWMQRRAAAIARAIQSDIVENIDAATIIDRIQQRTFEIDKSLHVNQYDSIDDIASTALERILSIQGMEGGIIGAPSGYSELDALTAGWQNTDLTIIAGRPSMGKTAFALELAMNAAKQGYGCGIFSLEMGKYQLGQRMLTMVAQADAQRARTGSSTEEELKQIEKAYQTIKDYNIHIEDSSFMTPMRLRSVARKMVREKGVNLLIIDYLQLLTSGGLYDHNRENEIAFISRSLKGIAKDLDIPVLALAQLSRRIESRGDKVPMLSDLRESGQIEQDADNVIFVHRPEKFGIKYDEKERSTAGVAELHISKQRNGPIGVVRLAFHEKYASFHAIHEHTLPPREETPPVINYDDDDEPPF
jgi:replicative DNA helicase